MRIECAGVICLEVFKLFPQMGRFTLRDESKYLPAFDYVYLQHDELNDVVSDKTIAIGKVLKVVE